MLIDQTHYLFFQSITSNWKLSSVNSCLSTYSCKFRRQLSNLIYFFPSISSKSDIDIDLISPHTGSFGLFCFVLKEKFRSTLAINDGCMTLSCVTARENQNNNTWHYVVQEPLFLLASLHQGVGISPSSTSLTHQICHY